MSAARSARHRSSRPGPPGQLCNKKDGNDGNDGTGSMFGRNGVRRLNLCAWGMDGKLCGGLGETS